MVEAACAILFQPPEKHGVEAGWIDDLVAQLLVERRVPGHVAKGRESDLPKAVDAGPQFDLVHERRTDAETAVLGQNVELLEVKARAESFDQAESHGVIGARQRDP